MESPAPYTATPPPIDAARLAEIRAEYAEYLKGEELAAGRPVPADPTPDDFVFPYTRDVGPLLTALDTATARAAALEQQLHQARQEAADTEVDKLRLIRDVQQAKDRYEAAEMFNEALCIHRDRVMAAMMAQPPTYEQMLSLPTPPAAGVTAETHV